MLFAYALGKAQRLLAGIDPAIGPIYVHGAVQRVNRLYREAGVALPEAHYTPASRAETDWSQALIIAPTSARDTPWLRRFGRFSDGFASGLDAGARAAPAPLDRPGLRLVRPRRLAGPDGDDRETGAERVFVTHGYTAASWPAG